MDAKIQQVEVDGLYRYPTRLLGVQDFPELCAPKEAMFPRLQNRPSKAPELATSYITEIQRL